MLRRVDKGLELIGWLAALALVVMLFAGPKVIADDKPASRSEAGAAPYAGGGSGGGGAAADGRALFTENCGSCHTLSAAGTSGSVGPNLDDISLEAAGIENVVRGGSGSMPAFGDSLSDAEIKAVAEFVAGS